MKPLKSSARPISKRIGTVQTIDANTGKVVAERHNAATLLGPPPNVCQVCAADHPHDQPHNQQSLYYQMRFHSEHGRWPTWTDAMSHCSDDVKSAWRDGLIAMMKENGIEVPEDLQDGGQTP